VQTWERLKNNFPLSPPPFRNQLAKASEINSLIFTPDQFPSLRLRGFARAFPALRWIFRQAAKEERLPASFVSG